MIAVFIIFLVVLMLSLYHYVDRAEWEELSANVNNSLFRNKKYGAYKIRQQQNGLIVFITVGAVLLSFGAIFAKRTVDNWDAMDESASELSDTTQFVMNKTDIPIELPPSSFNFNGNNGDNLPVAQDGADKPEKVEKESNSTTTPSNQPEKTEPASKPRSKNESLDDWIKRVKEESANSQAGARAEAERKAEENKRKKEEIERKKNQAVNGGNGGQQGTKAGSQGETMVSYDLDGRKAFQKDDSNVKNPGYTCGKGISARVVVKVRVNSNGNVITATSMAPAGTNACCVEQAIKYAKLSRFEFANVPFQEGTITYNFKAQ